MLALPVLNPPEDILEIYPQFLTFHNPYRSSNSLSWESISAVSVCESKIRKLKKYDVIRSILLLNQLMDYVKIWRAFTVCLFCLAPMVVAWWPQLWAGHQTWSQVAFTGDPKTNGWLSHIYIVLLITEREYILRLWTKTFHLHSSRTRVDFCRARGSPAEGATLPQ